MDLKKVVGTINNQNDVKKKIEEYSEKMDNIGGNKEVIEKLDSIIKESKRKIEQYKRMLNEDSTEWDTVQASRHQGSIKELIKEEEDIISKSEEKKAEIEEQANKKDEEAQKRELLDEQSAFYTQTMAKLKNDIEALEMENQLIMKFGIQKPKYVYENASPLRKEQLDKMVAAGTDMKLLESNALMEKINDLKAALELCESQKAKIQAEFNKSVEQVQNVKNETYGKTETNKSNPAKDDSKKDEPKKDEPKKDEPKNDEPKKDEPKKDEPKNDKSKPAKINGELYYASLGIFDKYKMKRKAYEISEGTDEVSFGTKIRLLLPSAKYKDMASDMISNGEIKVFTPDVPVQSKPESNDSKGVENKEELEFGQLSAEEKAEINKATRELALKMAREMKDKKKQEKAQPEKTGEPTK